MKKEKITNLNHPVGVACHATQNKQSCVGAGPVSAQNAITLVALVITVIILLILAGVTINLTLGNNGIFSTAQKAAQNYTEAQNKEIANLNEFNASMNDIIVEKWSEPYETTEKYNYTDSEGKKATIPAGFQVSLKDGETTVKDGLVIRNAQDKNEFVWVPVEGMAYTYDRYDFGKQIGNYSEYSEAMPADEIESVTNYGGYYIGRYEAGIAGTIERSESDVDAKKTAEEIELDWGKALSQKGKHAYNCVTREQAKGLAKRVYTKVNDNITSKICSSYAWDTALKFIETRYPEYPTDSTGGNYKIKEEGTLKKTGYHGVNNIYDMGGNVYEFTTEISDNSENKDCVFRGGSFTSTVSAWPSGARNVCGTPHGYPNKGFRIILFL